MKILSSFMTILLLSACSPEVPTPIKTEEPVIAQDSTPLPPVDSMDETALPAEWVLIAQAPQKFKGDPRVFAIGLHLDTLSPTALSPFIALLGKPETSAETKTFILESTQYYMDTDYIPHLTPLLNSSDPTTRSCATALFGRINDEVVIKASPKCVKAAIPVWLLPPGQAWHSKVSIPTDASLSINIFRLQYAPINELESCASYSKV